MGSSELQKTDGKLRLVVGSDSLHTFGRQALHDVFLWLNKEQERVWLLATTPDDQKRKRDYSKPRWNLKSETHVGNSHCVWMSWANLPPCIGKTGSWPVSSQAQKFRKTLPGTCSYRHHRSEAKVLLNQGFPWDLEQKWRRFQSQFD